MNRQRVRLLEAKLARQLQRDAAHPSRCEEAEDGTINVTMSGTSVGLIMAITAETREDDGTILGRVAP